MNRSDLIDAVARQKSLPRKRAEDAVSALFDALSEALREEQRVEIRGFGSFTVRRYDPYTGRNPRTGEAVEVPAKRAPFFRVGKELRDLIND